MKILLGVTSSISIYKCLSILRLLVSAGHEVKVIMTENAAKMVSPIVFKALCNNDVFIKDFDINSPITHVRICDWADVFAIVPATGNTIAKIANGITDNLLTSTVLANTKRLIICPAMNVHMYENKATTENLDKLYNRGVEIVDAGYGSLACGYKGKGRLADEELIAAVITQDPNKPLKGKKYIVTAGGTIERLDPVRYISNFSSGKMGIEIAKKLFNLGAEVLLIYGNISVKPPEYIDSLKIESAEELLAVINVNIPSFDGLFMACAPADWKPQKTSETKIKKGKDTNSLKLELTVNPDILKELNKAGKNIIAFALETGKREKAISDAKIKMQEKGADYIVLNIITGEQNPLSSDENQVTIISKDGKEIKSEKGPKEQIAKFIIENTIE
jgi:phosphopantothenoylcysteine decarboxylase / phosphopantothenate---cysteine ligase